MKNILVIDDEELIRNLLYSLLEREGYKVFEAANGNFSSKLISDVRIDLVITDIFMPEKDGFEVIWDLKKNYPDIKILAISGQDDTGKKGFLFQAKKFGAHQTMAKPFSPDEFLKIVKELIDD